MNVERSAGTTDRGASVADLDEQARFEARVQRAFLRDGRLVSIPAQDRKRQVILRWLVGTCFVEDRAYPEKEVNMCLALVHPDVAALWRYLVEAGLMTRASGEYRRAAGPPPAASGPTGGLGAGPQAS